jgi:hypothetical protein
MRDKNVLQNSSWCAGHQWRVYRVWSFMMCTSYLQTVWYACSMTPTKDGTRSEQLSRHSYLQEYSLAWTNGWCVSTLTCHKNSVLQIDTQSNEIFDTTWAHRLLHFLILDEWLQPSQSSLSIKDLWWRCWRRSEMKRGDGWWRATARRIIKISTEEVELLSPPQVPTDGYNRPSSGRQRRGCPYSSLRQPLQARKLHVESALSTRWLVSRGLTSQRQERGLPTAW